MHRWMPGNRFIRIKGGAVSLAGQQGVVARVFSDCVIDREGEYHLLENIRPMSLFDDKALYAVVSDNGTMPVKGVTEEVARQQARMLAEQRPEIFTVVKMLTEYQYVVPPKPQGEVKVREL